MDAAGTFNLRGENRLMLLLHDELACPRFVQFFLHLLFELLQLLLVLLDKRLLLAFDLVDLQSHQLTTALLRERWKRVVLFQYWGLLFDGWVR